MGGHEGVKRLGMVGVPVLHEHVGVPRAVMVLSPEKFMAAGEKSGAW